jgi:hypothetical protein
MRQLESAFQLAEGAMFDLTPGATRCGTWQRGATIMLRQFAPSKAMPLDWWWSDVIVCLACTPIEEKLQQRIGGFSKKHFEDRVDEILGGYNNDDGDQYLQHIQTSKTRVFSVFLKDVISTVSLLQPMAPCK